MYGLCVLFSSRVVSIHSRSYSSRSTKRLLDILADMPKETSARIVEAQRQRQQISKKSEKYGPSTVYLQVLGSGAKGAPNTLYLFTDQKRYLFNCGECTQRLAHEHKVKLSRLDHIFITSKTWRSIGGLPGLSLTLQDVGVPNITLHGPDGLDELYNATKRFVIMKDMNVTMAKCRPGMDFEDNVMTVKYVHLGPEENLLAPQSPNHQASSKPDADIDKEFEEFIHDDTDYYRRDGKKGKAKPKHTVEKNNVQKKNEKVLQDLQKNTHCTVSYICILKDRMGTLDLAKCVEKGVKPGPMLGQLKNGQDVVLPDGTVVLSKDVKTPDDPGPVFIVLDVPDPSYLKESEFKAHFATDSNPPENVPVLIVHFTPPHVFHHPTYVSFMSKFGPGARHLVLNSQNTCLGSEAVHRTQHKLHLLDPDIFPLLRDVSVPAVWTAQSPTPKTDSPVKIKGLEELKNKIALAQFQNIISLEGPCKGDGQLLVEDKENEFKMEVLAGRTLTIFNLRPKRQLDRSAEPKLHIQEYIQEPMDADGFVASLQQFRRLVDGIRFAKSDAPEYPKVVFLGTGSCIPSKTRNTSAIIVQVSEDRSILLDCGEGTFGQLVRFYGPKKVNAFLRTLQAIYISHLHADHHIGLIGVLQARREAFAETGTESYSPVYLLAPGQIVTWLTLYHEDFEPIRDDYSLIPNQNLMQEVHHPELTSAALAAIGIAGLRTCLVSHCPNAFGLALQLTGQYKLTYSGDTLPCQDLIKIGQDSTLLIHEATMEDELADEARTKMHSTTTQAIDIGRQMNAKYTVLTHFSQRYARLPRLNANILNDNQSVGIAFDNMQITMNDLELLPHMYAPLQLMFAEHCVEMELKAAHRQRLKDRANHGADSPHPESVEENRKSSLRPTSSRRSIGTRSTTSSLGRQASYRESNSSRLRRENSMTIASVADNSLLRSRSPSATRKPATRSPSRSSQSPLPNKERSPSRKESVTSKAPDLATSRTLSEISNLNKDCKERLRINKGPSGVVVDTQSKTLNSVPQRPAIEEAKDVLPINAKKTAPNRPTWTTPKKNPEIKEQTNGYGKPLVTPVKKRLTIRREESCMPPSRVINREPITAAPCAIRSRSPSMVARVSLDGYRSPLINRQKSDAGSTKLLNYINTPKLNLLTTVLRHILYWRVAIVVSLIYPQGMSLIFIITALGLLFWAATKAIVSRNKLRASNTSPNVLPDTKIPVLKNNFGPKSLPPVSQNISKANKTISKEPTSAKYDPRDAKAKCRPLQRETRDHNLSRINSRPDHSPSPARPPIRSKSPNLRSATDAEKKSNLNKNESCTQEIRSKSPISGKGSHPQPVKTVANFNVPTKTKGFKPQLEDIESSYIMMNKKVQEVNLKVSSVKSISPIPKPKVLDEEMRKQHLMETKKKFKSKQYWDDMKFDRIEGLNWISWK